MFGLWVLDGAKLGHDLVLDVGYSVVNERVLGAHDVEDGLDLDLDLQADEFLLELNVF